MLFFCMVWVSLHLELCMWPYHLDPLSVLEYAIYNNLLGAHGWSRVRVLAQKTSDDKKLDKIKRRVAQMEKAHKVWIEPKIQASPEV
jgi:hypothetical protein